MNHYHAAFIGKVNNVIRYGKFYRIYFYSNILGELKRMMIKELLNASKSFTQRCL